MASSNRCNADTQLPSIHPINPNAHLTRPIVSFDDWSCMSSTARIDRFGSCGIDQRSHPATRQHASGVDIDDRRLSVETGLASYKSAAAPRPRAVTEPVELMQTIVRDFAYTCNRKGAYFRGVQGKRSRARSVSDAVHHVYRRLSAVSWTGGITASAEEQTGEEHRAKPAKPRKLLAIAPSESLSSMLSNSVIQTESFLRVPPDEEVDMHWEPIVQLIACSNVSPTKKSARHSKPDIHQDEENLALTPKCESTNAKRQALKELPINTRPNQEALRIRAKNKVSSIGKKVKQTIEIWRDD